MRGSKASVKSSNDTRGSGGTGHDRIAIVRCAFEGLWKHDRTVSVQEHPPLDEGFDGAGERDAFDVSSDREQLLRPVRMVDTLDGLLDDRAFIEIVGDEMRGRADQLDAARMRW